MKTEKDKEIDDLFKKGLEPSDTPSGHMEGDWNAMEQMLHEHKRRPMIVYWLPILGSVAALLLVIIGWWFLKPVVTHQKHQQQMAINKIDTKTPGNGKSGVSENKKGEKQQLTAKNIDTVTPPDDIGRQRLRANANKNSVADNVNNIRRGHSYNKLNTPFTANASDKNNIIAAQTQGGENTRQQGAELVAYSPSMVIDEQPLSAQSIKPADYVANDNSNKPSYISKRRIGSPMRPQFAITVLAASDKNGVGSFQQTKPGNNAGLLFSVGLGKRFTVSTGAVYNAKQYISSFANYHTSYQFPTNPVSVLANCKMFDIPLNIDYRVFNSYRNKISVGTGVSSYLMLNESYQYNYAEYANGPQRYNVPNPDKYLFSIVNLQATYERQINSSVGITLQPYMKLPLSAVGASQVRLQSTGVAVGLTWNLNSSSKP